MKNVSRRILVAGLGLAMMQVAAGAEEKSGLKDQKEKESYSIGMNVGNSIKNGGVELDVDVLAAAIRDVLAGRELKLTDQEARDALNEYRKEARAKQDEIRQKSAEKNHKEAEAFLAENKNKPGVKTHSVTLPDGTAAEMQYKVITEGTGEVPKSNDMVSANYRGTLIYGKEFDSSAKRGGQPSKFGVLGVIPGWTAALEMMKVGSKWELYLPPSLAYGDRGFPPNVEPGAALIFELELVGTETPAPPPPPQPLTSDIIRVPSAEELKAGSNIQVLKPEDVEKLIKAQTNATNKAEKKP